MAKLIVKGVTDTVLFDDLETTSRGLVVETPSGRSVTIPIAQESVEALVRLVAEEDGLAVQETEPAPAPATGPEPEATQQLVSHPIRSPQMTPPAPVLPTFQGDMGAPQFEQEDSDDPGEVIEVSNWGDQF